MGAIGERIRQIRGEMPQGEFAKKFGLSQSAIWSVESGRTEPSADLLRKLVVQFGVDLNWLLADVPSPGAARETTGRYFVRPDTDAIIEQLRDRPNLLPIISRLIEMDANKLNDAQSLAKLLDVPVEIAALVLAMKKEKP